MRTQNLNACTQPDQRELLREFTIDDLRVLGLIAHCGSMNAVARQFGVSKSVLSRGLSKLEAMAGGPLFERTTRGMRLTATGEVLLPVAERAISLLQDADEALRSVKGTPQGPLRIAASALAGQQLAAPAIARMAQVHPGVEISLSVTNLPTDPVENRFDVVLCLERPRQTFLTSRRIMSSTMALYAVGNVARRMDLSDVAAVEALGRVVIAVENVPATWRLTADNGRQIEMDAPPIASVGDPSIALGVLHAGRGVTMIPTFYGERHVGSGTLVRALPGWTGDTVELFAALPPRRASVPAVAAFLDILADQAATLQVRRS